MEELDPQPLLSMDELLASAEEPVSMEDARLQAVIEAMVYVTEEPLTVAQMAAVLEQPPERVRGALEQLVAEFEKPGHGVTIREVAGGFQMATKPEHHEAVRNLVRSLKSPLKLSLAALETLSVIAYKQPVTAPEVMEIRGVQGAGVIKTLLDRKLITTAGHKEVIGKPILYKTTKDFLVQFGLKDLSELPSLKEFEEIRRLAMAESETPGTETAASETAPNEPAVSEPAASESAVSEPAFSEPAASEPAVSESAANESAANESAASESAVSEPAASEPAFSEPAASEPAVSESAANESAANESAVSEPAASEPAVSEPAASEPSASDSAAPRPET
jgi:segregation and condensation protein B